jgi:glutamate-1-semialdehyde aminotransferase
MLAAKAMMLHLVTNEREVYLRLAELGHAFRDRAVTAFAEEGVLAKCTGHLPDVLPGSSLLMIHFPRDQHVRLERPEDVYDPAVCDTELSLGLLQAALLLEDVNLMHAHGAASFAHTESDVDFFGEACRKVARRLRPCIED